MVMTKERRVTSLADLVETAKQLRIDFSGTHKLNQDTLDIIYNSLRLIHQQAKKAAPPVFTRKVAEAQAAITLIKSKKKPEDIEKLLEKLVEHLETSLSLMEISKEKRKAA